VTSDASKVSFKLTPLFRFFPTLSRLTGEAVTSIFFPEFFLLIEEEEFSKSLSLDSSKRAFARIGVAFMADARCEDLKPAGSPVLTVLGLFRRRLWKRPWLNGIGTSGVRICGVWGVETASWLMAAETCSAPTDAERRRSMRRWLGERPFREPLSIRRQLVFG
jgi:hypothetical protein